MRADRSLKSRIRWKEWKKESRRGLQGVGTTRAERDQHHRPPVTFDAPEVLSLIDSPEAAVSFFRQLQSHFKHRDVFVNLSGVRVITPDAVALLLAMVGMLSGRKSIRVRGNYPVERTASDTIRASGFDQYISTSSSSPSGNPKGAIVRRDLSFESNRADGHYASRLIDFASKDDANKLRLKVAYAHLVECMGNTHEHAGHYPGDQPWWASVFRDSGRQCDCFTFVDMGVGIFNSVELSVRLRMYKLTGLLKPNILRELLEGKIRSSTGKSYRGRGLPSIYRSCIEGKVRRLVIVTNDVYADAAAGTFQPLHTELMGVVLYWEVPL